MMYILLCIHGVQEEMPLAQLSITNMRRIRMQTRCLSLDQLKNIYMFTWVILVTLAEKNDDNDGDDIAAHVLLKLVYAKPLIDQISKILSNPINQVLL